MLCPRCHAENREGRRFCGECGQSFALPCPFCGFVNEGNEKFCGGCGAPSVGSRDAPQARFASPETYTPKHLAEKILTSKSALEGERKQVTVLFADLKGSMELLADRDPEEARKILDPVLERMMEAVHRYEGTVNQVMGDGIMALFGAPLAHEDHAVRACYAALRMQESVRRYADGVRREHAVAVHIRVGLNSGEVVVRAIGSDLRMDYTAVGQTTHLAARMEQLADPGSILLTTDTLALGEGFVEVTSLGPMAVKGLAAPLEVYELTGVSAVRSRLQAAAVRGLSRFVGRDAEIGHLHRALEQARQGQGQVAVVVGEAGVGKSRLVFELIHSHRVEGWPVLETRSVSYGKATSYLPVIDLLKGYFRIGDRDTHREIREKATGKILTLDRALEPTLPALLDLLDVPVDDHQWQAFDPPQRRQRTLDAVKRLLLREAQVQPLLVVFEDLHWIDSETQALLDSLIESLPAVRLLLLVNYRPEYSHGWGSKTFYTQIRLDTLPPESTGELLDALLGADSSLEPLKNLLAGKTGGNPLFIEESVRTLVETRALVGERGAYHLAQPVETVQVPATVQAILASRIDRLQPEEKRLLEIAAVIGKDFPLALLQAVADENEETLRRALGHLQTAEFLYETSLFPDLEYTFKHALTHEVAYGSLLHDRRRDLHARIAGAIERLYGDRLTEQVERLAQHALRGEQWEKAVVLYRQAGAKCLARSAGSEAANSFEQALTALGHCPDGRGTRELSVDIRCDLQGPLVGLGELTRMLDHLRQAEAVASGLDDQSRLGKVSAHMTTCFWWMGEYEKAVESGRRAQAIASSLGDLELQVLSNFRLGQAYFYLGEFGPAVEVFQWNVEALRGDLERKAFGMPALPAVSSRTFLGNHRMYRGDFTPALGLMEQAVHVAEAADHQYSLFLACYTLGSLHVSQGRPEGALPWLERSLDLYRRGNFAFLFPVLSAWLGRAWALTGRVTEAVDLLEQAERQVASMRTGNFGAQVASALAEVYLAAGRLEDAMASARASLQRGRAQREPVAESLALWVLGEILSLSRPPEPEQAAESYGAALAIADRLSLRPLVAKCHLGLGKLYRRTAKRQAAREHLATATTMLREMDMRYWLETAEQELKSLA